MLSLYGQSVYHPHVLIVWSCMLAVSQAYVNFALDKPAYQIYPWERDDPKKDANNAVDGRKSDLSWDGGQCSISQGTPSAIWWVNLTSIHNIHHITIYFMTGNKPWANSRNWMKSFVLGFSVYVSNTTDRLKGTLCYKDDNFTLDTIPAVFTTTCPVHGQYVIYYNERLPGVTYPGQVTNYSANFLCEVEVYGCPTKGFYYGNDCCPDIHCQFCDIEKGTCVECEPGYEGHRCNFECTDGKYGESCRHDCGHCRTMTQCDHVDGTCGNGCETGYTGRYCQQLKHLFSKACNRGFYGIGCNETCGHCRDSEHCFYIDGFCLTGCDAGYKGGLCKTECNEQKYGEGCMLDCGHCKDMSQCHHVDGRCMDGCDPGYIHCDCQQRCSIGFYGVGCSSICGHCSDKNQCSHINGTCLTGCQAGFLGNTCTTQCTNRKYGDGCIRDCGHCKNMDQCHHVDGTCEDGCEPGYKEYNCTQRCDIGLYGVNCNETCGHCLDIKKCFHINGTCLTGCAAGYRGTLCKTLHQLSRSTLFVFIYTLSAILGFTWIVFIIVVLCKNRHISALENGKPCAQKNQVEDTIEQMTKMGDDSLATSTCDENNHIYLNLPEKNNTLWKP